MEFIVPDNDVPDLKAIGNGNVILNLKANHPFYQPFLQARAEAFHHTSSVLTDEYDAFYRQIAIFVKGEFWGGFRCIQLPVKQSVYTQSLFAFAQDRFCNPNAAEAGRAFLSTAGRQPLALSVLWNAIVYYVEKHLNTNIILGTVNLGVMDSDTQRATLQYLKGYSSAVQEVMPLYNLNNEVNSALPTAPLNPHLLPDYFRWYLKLGAQIHSIGADPDLPNSLEVLMLLRTDQIAAAIRQRWFQAQVV